VNIPSQLTRSYCNHARFRPGDPGGHYESYFQRANHPSRPLAFWIRYTVFSPAGRPHEAIGELWAIYFDGEAGRITAAKEVVPLSACSFSMNELDVRIGSATLQDGELHGQAASSGHALAWSLRYAGDQPPLLLLPRSFYEGGFPKAKALVGTPLAAYNGVLAVDGVEISVDGWIGSQNHNWGSRHTDRYAWGQVAGFDDAPLAFLELSTARLKIGPLWTPWMTLVVLRLEGQEYVLNSLAQSIRAYGRFEFGQARGSNPRWRFDSRAAGVRLHGEITAPASSFVGLRYANPPGGYKTCLNTKLARCDLVLERTGQPTQRFIALNRAAFEILTDDEDHGVPVIL
jgi:hypothetical protein